MLCTSLFAHSPTHSTTIISKGENGLWTVQIRAALTAYEQEVHTRFGKDSYKTPEAFSELILKILNEDFKLTFNQELVKLENEQVRLGHETIVFSNFQYLNAIETIEVQNEIFKDIFNSKNTVFVVLDDKGKNEFTLTKGNDFQADLKLVNGKLLNTSQNIEESDRHSNQSHTYRYIVYGILGFVVLALIIFWKKKKENCG